MATHRIPRHSGDAGVALVMAMGVALIGIIVASIVITMVIVAANDSGRDRVRTTEVHSAEAAIDTVIAELQVSTPDKAICVVPNSNYGSGAQETNVAVTIAYYVDTSVTPLTCADGKLSVTPSRAVITSTSTAVKKQVGIPPVRTMQAEVILTPIPHPAINSAIFSASGLGTSAQFHLEPAVNEDSATVWIDSGDWNCSGGGNQISTYGSVFVPAGSFNINANCVVNGDVWVQQNLTTSNSSVANPISGSMTVRSGKLTLGKPTTIGGSATLGMARDPQLTAKGGIQDNLGADNIQPNYTSVGLPPITYDFSKWSGFTSADALNFNALMNTQWGTTGLSVCDKNVGSKPPPTAPPLLLPAGPTVFNLTYPVGGGGCPGTIDVQSLTLQLRADTAIFLDGLTVTNLLNVTSVDKDASGKIVPHKLWIIVPSTATTGCRCLDSTSTKIVFDSSVETFLYAPGSVSMNPHGDFNGQIYGGVVNLKNDADMHYTYVGVPGGYLTKGLPSIIGYKAELVYKHEGT